MPQYTRSLSHGNFSTGWSPLIRPPFTGSFQNHSVHTPLLSGESGYSSYGSPSWGNNNTSPTLNGWPAIMQQTHHSPSGGETQGNSSGVVFIHGFGGGVFSWRHVMGSVAREVGCRVVAFDRPGWGLTTRPQRSEWEQKGLPNPYELQTQVCESPQSTVHSRLKKRLHCTLRTCKAFSISNMDFLMRDAGGFTFCFLPGVGVNLSRACWSF